MGRVPFLLNDRRHQHVDDADTHGANHYPKHDKPRGGVGLQRRRQGGDDVHELQRLIGQQEGAVDTTPGLPNRQRSKQSGV